jgi:hypothetical protein
MDDDGNDLNRVTREVAGRLAARGVYLEGDETPDEITAMEDAVERFEEEVESHGGDLMVDEPPPRHRGQPDDRRFLLPVRAADMSVEEYVELLESAVDNIRSGR